MGEGEGLVGGARNPIDWWDRPGVGGRVQRVGRNCRRRQGLVGGASDWQKEPGRIHTLSLL